MDVASSLSDALPTRFTSRRNDHEVGLSTAGVEDTANSVEEE